MHDIRHFYKEIIVEKVKFITNYLFLSGKSINFAVANSKKQVNMTNNITLSALIINILLRYEAGSDKVCW